MTSEVDLGEYQRNPTEAQIALKRARDNLANVSINTLPLEVLAYIFQTTSAQQPCPLRSTNCWNAENPVEFPEYPDKLLHVCSRWRRVALGSPSIWSHIDIALSCPLSKRFHNRAAAYVARAHQVPLDIHLIDPGSIQQAESSVASDDSSDFEDDVKWGDWSDSMWKNNPDDFTFLASSSLTRIRSLRLVIRYRYHDVHNEALQHCFINCLPGGLSELVITAPSWAPPYSSFFKIIEHYDPFEKDVDELVLPENHLERTLHSITTLHLTGRHFKWNSTAYHGLTDLRLLGNRQITIPELTGILISSPMLHTIHCDFEITGSPTSSTSTIPVALRKLEVLELKGMSMENVESFLKLVSPGSKPLRLSFCGNPTPALQDIFTRLNFQEIRMIATMDDARLSVKTLCFPSQLRVLVMTKWIWGPTFEHEVTSVQLDTVYMLECYYKNTQLFRKAVAHFSPRRLVIWKCRINGTGKHRGSRSVFESALGKELSESCSIEYLTDEDPNPVQDWD